MVSESNKKTSLITGASSGIGLDLAHLFASDGHNLVLVARNQERLDDLADELRSKHGIQARVLPEDLADLDAPDRIFNTLNSENIEIDYLVNNAGFNSWGKLAETRADRELDMIKVNLLALYRLTKLYLPVMLKRNQGRILNVASTAGFVPGPYSAVYYASKAFVISMTEAIAEEIRDSNVTATVLCPGPTETEFFERADMMQTALKKGNTMSSKKVAEIGYKAMMKGKSTKIAGFANWLLIFSTRFSPRRLMAKIAASLNSKK